VQAFTDKQIKLVENFANKRSSDRKTLTAPRASRSLQQQTATAMCSGHQPLDLRSPAVLDTLVESAATLCERYGGHRRPKWNVFEFLATTPSRPSIEH